MRIFTRVLLDQFELPPFPNICSLNVFFFAKTLRDRPDTNDTNQLLIAFERIPCVRGSHHSDWLFLPLIIRPNWIFLICCAPGARV